MIYEYRCTTCEYIFTLKFPFARNPDTVRCSKCGGLSSRFFGTVPPICFKGAGWASKTELDARDSKNDSPQDFSDLTGE